MFVYKKLKASDIAVVPFNAHKQYTYTLKGKSDSIKHVYFVTASWSQSAIEDYGAAACAHRQLEHLYYGDYPLDVANKFGNVNYLKEHRQLDEEVYVYSVPQDMYGVQIKPKSLQIETISKVEDFRSTSSLGNKIQLTGRFIDDGLGNILHLETNLGSGSQAFTTESFPNSLEFNYPEYFKDDRIFYLNPINSYRFLDLTRTKHGKHIPDYATHSIHYDPKGLGLFSSLPEFDSAGCKVPAYSMEDVYEDSYYHGLVDYNNIRFTKYPYFPNYRLIPHSHSIDEITLGNSTDYTHHTFMDFHHQTPHSLNVLDRNDSGIVAGHGKKGGCYLRSPHNEKFDFNPGDDFTITFNLKPAPFKCDTNVSGSEFHIIGKSKTKTVNASALEAKAIKALNLNVSGANQEVEVESDPQYPFEIFLLGSNNGCTTTTILTEPITTSSIQCTGGIQIAISQPPAPWLAGYGDQFNRETQAPSGWVWDFSMGQYVNTNPGTIFSTSFSNQDLLDYLTGANTSVTSYPAQTLSSVGITGGTFSYNQNTGMLDGPISTLFPSNVGTAATSQSGPVLLGFLDNSNHPATTPFSSIPGWNSDPVKNYLQVNYLSAQEFINAIANNCNNITTEIAAGQSRTVSEGNTTYQSLCFRRSNGVEPVTVSTGPITVGTGSIYNVVCQYSESVMSIYIDGVLQVSELESINSGSICGKELGLTQNKANMYIGCQGGIQNFFTGSLQNIAIYPRALSDTEISENYYESKYIGTPVVGNIFYSMGLITITNPYYFNHFKQHDITSSISFKNTMPLVENEYQCTVDEQEFNFTNNVSTRCITNEEHENLANFATGSLWNPYVTTIGLYNEDYELLVVGKLGQPVRCSDETDTTFIVRWDS